MSNDELVKSNIFVATITNYSLNHVQSTPYFSLFTSHFSPLTFHLSPFTFHL